MEEVSLFKSQGEQLNSNVTKEQKIILNIAGHPVITFITGDIQIFVRISLQPNVSVHGDIKVCSLFLKS